MHHDGPTGTKKTVVVAGEKKQVTNYDRPSRKQECVQANKYCRSITAIGVTDDQKISSLFLESDGRVVGDDGVRGKKMKIEYERKAGETFTMMPFANGMQTGMLLQPMAEAGSGNRLTAVRFKHCTGNTLGKEVTIVVDAATKAAGLLDLMTLAQDDAAEAMDEKTVQPPYSPGSPNMETLAGSFLPAGEDTHELTLEEQVHREEAMEEARKASKQEANEKAKERRDGRSEEQKIKDSENRKEKYKSRSEEQKIKDSEMRKERKELRPEEQKIKDSERQKEKTDRGEFKEYYNSRTEEQKIKYSENRKEKYKSRSEKEKTKDSEKRKEKRKSRPEKQKKQRKEANQQNKKQRKEAPAKKQREKKPTTTTSSSSSSSSSSGRKSQRPARYNE